MQKKPGNFGVNVMKYVGMHIISYDMLFSRAYDTHLPHNPNPTHHVAYTRQRPFLHINTTSFRFYFGVLFIGTFMRLGWS